MDGLLFNTLQVGLVTDRLMGIGDEVTGIACVTVGANSAIKAVVKLVITSAFFMVNPFNYLRY